MFAMRLRNWSQSLLCPMRNENSRWMTKKWREEKSIWKKCEMEMKCQPIDTLHRDKNTWKAVKSCHCAATTWTKATTKNVKENKFIYDWKKYTLLTFPDNPRRWRWIFVGNKPLVFAYIQCFLCFKYTLMTTKPFRIIFFSRCLFFDTIISAIFQIFLFWDFFPPLNAAITSLFFCW